MPSRYGLTIRAAEPADAEGLADLFRASGLAIDVRGLGERLAAARAEGGAVLLADEWGPPSGVAALNWRWSLATPLRLATLNALVVAPDARRRGVGRLLLKAASQAARLAGCGELRLEVPASAAELQAFAGATGFAETGAVLVRQLRKRN